MNIVILGAGAVGGYLGGRLAEAGVPVSFLVRERRADQLSEKGIRIKSVHGDFSAESVDLYTDAEQIPECDVVIVTVKGYQVEGAMPQLRTLVAKGAKILPFLNGMEHFRFMEESFGEENVLGGLAFIISTLDENGGIVQTSEQHDFVFGALRESQKAFCNRLETTLSGANVNVKNSDHILRDLWQKYTFITAFSGITTASRLPIGKVRENQETLKLFQTMIEEMQALATVNKIDLGERLVDAVTEQVRGLPEEGTSSMHQDLRKGMPIEVESLHGGALRIAKEKGVKLPTIQTIYALLKPYEQGDK
ncbi:MAG TPA: ketopantoate reductase family protein [Bacillales bacterium]|nr:ketopantoate reductase family protein [Bacillales bacterium]